MPDFESSNLRSRILRATFEFTSYFILLASDFKSKSTRKHSDVIFEPRGEDNGLLKCIFFASYFVAYE